MSVLKSHAVVIYGTLRAKLNFHLFSALSPVLWCNH